MQFILVHQKKKQKKQYSHWASAITRATVVFSNFKYSKWYVLLCLSLVLLYTCTHRRLFNVKKIWPYPKTMIRSIKEILSYNINRYLRVNSTALRKVILRNILKAFLRINRRCYAINWELLKVLLGTSSKRLMLPCKTSDSFVFFSFQILNRWLHSRWLYWHKMRYWILVAKNVIIYIEQTHNVNHILFYRHLRVIWPANVHTIHNFIIIKTWTRIVESVCNMSRMIS